MTTAAITKSARLAINGGKPAVEGRLAPFNEIGNDEAYSAFDRMIASWEGPLSGYLGGELKGGRTVEKLEYEFAGTVGSKHAIAVNSATSGLLIACMAADVGPNGCRVATTPFTMSATAAAPSFLGGEDFSLEFGDIEGETFCLDKIQRVPDVIMITNLFGHPAKLAYWKEFADGRHRVKTGTILIEDNAQAPFAMEGTKYAGTIGHIGVFSGNVHKAIQCGEGGICVTDDDDLAHKMRLARNHGEMAGGPIGLNLRLSEVHAAIWLAQLAKREQIISERIEIAEAMTDMVKGFPGLTPPSVRHGCKSVYYCWALRLEHNRDWFVDAMVAEGVPLRKGYVKPLYHLPAFAKFKPEGGCPVAEQAHETLALYENCAWTPTARQLTQMKEAFLKVIDNMPKMG